MTARPVSSKPPPGDEPIMPPVRSNTSGKNRLRTRQACETCRKRKRKCNGLYPCDQCAGYEYRCQYALQNLETALINPPPHPPSDVFNVAVGPKTIRSENDDTARQHGLNPKILASPPSSSSTTTARTTQCTSPKSRSSVPYNGRAVVEPRKGRFSYAHSGVVLPRKLSQQIQLQEDLKFHSYGWNLGIRPEPQKAVAPAVRDHLTFQDLTFYSRIYFDVVDPVYHFVYRARFFDRCAKYWLAEKPELDDIEALISGVVALGSFFAAVPSPAESQLVEHTKTILDTGCAYAPARLSMDQAAAWILRTLYLRLTTRPHLSWYASCTAVHVVEAMGLHVDLETVDLAGDDSMETLTSDFISSRRSIVECAVFLNAVISAEYGRSRISLSTLDFQRQSEEKINSNSSLWNLTRLLVLAEGELNLEERVEILTSIHNLPEENPLFVLLKTDVAIHMCRMQINVNAKHERPSGLEAQAVLTIIRASFAALRQLLVNRQPWWNLISTPFQSAMILMAIESSESLDLVVECMSILILIYETFKTHFILEVIQTTKYLIEGLEKRKLHQISSLRKAMEISNVIEDLPSTAQGPPVTIPDQAFGDSFMEGQNTWSFMTEIDALGNFSLGNISNFP
ncbi:hypothetical protein B7463_g12487, partial [Scytalidium lignicola]